MNTRTRLVVTAAVLFGCAVRAEVVIETVTVCNPGNAGENAGFSEPGGYGQDRVCGAVDYIFNIGIFEVTAGHYTEFLNAVAGDDPYGLYYTSMLTSIYGCKIERGGSSPNYTYSVTPDRADRPVNYVCWGSAARFANWLHNGQPTGAMNLSTTEDGSYYLNGMTSNDKLQDVVRELDATWVIPSEDEWYKAAYYDGGSGVYYDYATSSDSVPSNDLIDPDPGNNVTFCTGVGEYTIDAPYWRTEVGAHENSISPYGTLDQSGSVWEWNEALLVYFRGIRGGSYYIYNWYGYATALQAAYRGDLAPSYSHHDIGFRVARVSPPRPTDLDDDGDTDLHDFAISQTEFDGDLLAYAAFQLNFVGPK